MGNCKISVTESASNVNKHHAPSKGKEGKGIENPNRGG